MQAKEVKIDNQEELSAIIFKRGINLKDVKEAVAAGENPGIKLYRSDDENRFLARAKVGKWNIYAEYTPKGNVFKVHTAYAHRVMFIKDETR